MKCPFCDSKKNLYYSLEFMDSEIPLCKKCYEKLLDYIENENDSLEMCDPRTHWKKRERLYYESFEN